MSVATMNEKLTRIKTAVDRIRIATDTTGEVIENVASAVENIAPLEEKDVNFYDYDGTLLYSYTLAEAQALTELPPAPAHEGLTFQEWNWDLADIKAENDLVDIGATYITDNGDTRIYIELPEDRLDPYLGIMGSGDIEVDWGDGSEKQTITNSTSSVVKTQHIYPQKGKYVISLKPIQTAQIYINGSSGPYLIDDATHTGKGRAYWFCIKKIEIGKQVYFGGSYYYSQIFANTGIETITIPNNVNINQSATGFFQGCRQLVACVVPKGWTKITDYFLDGCTKLSCFCVPKSVTTLGSYSLENTSTLKKIIIPNSVVTVGGQAFRSMYSLKKVKFSSAMTSIPYALFQYENAINEYKIPSNIINIGQQAFAQNYNLVKIEFLGSVTTIGSVPFQGCQGLKKITFLNCTTVPTIPANSIPTVDDLQIVVPDALYEDWIATSGWDTYASYIVKASEV